MQTVPMSHPSVGTISSSSFVSDLLLYVPGSHCYQCCTAFTDTLNYCHIAPVGFADCLAVVVIHSYCARPDVHALLHGAARRDT